MKRIHSIVLFLIAFIPALAQVSSNGITIDFESTNDYILFDQDFELWEIGIPDKNIFTESHSGEKAIMTGTKNSYGNSISTYFQINCVDPAHSGGTILTFYHMFDTESNSDYGYVSYSFDGGGTWIVCEDTTFLFDSICEFEVEINHCTEIPGVNFTCPNAKNYFSGSQRVWAKEMYYFAWWYEVKKSANNWEACAPDSILFRFNFESDNITDNKDGWIIDDILAEWRHYGYTSIVEPENIKIYPNPFQDQLIIENSEFSTMKLFDIRGRLLYTIILTDFSKNTINTSSLDAGVYFIIIDSKEYGPIYRKIISY